MFYLSLKKLLLLHQAVKIRRKEFFFSALELYGLKESENGSISPELEALFNASSLSSYTSKTSWCGVYIEHVCKKFNLPIPKNPYMARSWLNVGKETSKPKIGDIVVFWREDPKSWTGHVSLFVNYSKDKQFIYCLGGNQSDRVQISKYKAEQLLGFRDLFHEDVEKSGDD